MATRSEVIGLTRSRRKNPVFDYGETPSITIAFWIVSKLEGMPQSIVARARANKTKLLDQRSDDFVLPRLLSGVAGVMDFRTFWEQPFAPALTPAGKSGPAALGLHPRAKTVLTFPGAL
jgi:hypothetical protein